MMKMEGAASDLAGDQLTGHRQIQTSITLRPIAAKDG
jgi:hypothetical protein